MRHNITRSANEDEGGFERGHLDRKDQSGDIVVQFDCGLYIDPLRLFQRLEPATFNVTGGQLNQRLYIVQV